MSHFRTFTVVAEIADDHELRSPGLATAKVHDQLAPLGFLSIRVRNEHNETGEMPPWVSERSAS